MTTIESNNNIEKRTGRARLLLSRGKKNNIRLNCYGGHKDIKRKKERTSRSYQLS